MFKDLKMNSAPEKILLVACLRLSFKEKKARSTEVDDQLHAVVKAVEVPTENK